MSVKPSARSSSSATYRGAKQMAGILGRRTVVVSRAPSAASARGARMRPAAPTNERVVRKRRRVCVFGIGNLPVLLRSRFQLAFELVQETPICAVGDDLLRARLDHAGFMQSQRVEPEAILGVVFAPFVV